MNNTPVKGDANPVFAEAALAACAEARKPAAAEPRAPRALRRSIENESEGASHNTNARILIECFIVVISFACLQRLWWCGTSNANEKSASCVSDVTSYVRTYGGRVRARASNDPRLYGYSIPCICTNGWIPLLSVSVNIW